MSAAAKAAHKEWTLDVISSAFTCEGHRFFSHACDGPTTPRTFCPKGF